MGNMLREKHVKEKTCWSNGWHPCPSRGVGTRQSLGPTQPKPFYDSIKISCLNDSCAIMIQTFLKHYRIM